MPTAIYDIIEQKKFDIRFIRNNIVGKIIFYCDIDHYGFYVILDQ